MAIKNTDCDNISYNAIDIMSDHNYKDYMGMTIGNAYILGQTTPHIKPSGSKKIRYLCKCNLCGRKFITYRDTLTMHLKGKSSHPLSCGCDVARKPIIPGEKIGKLTIERLIINGSTTESRFWICRCECGREIKKRESNLLNRTIKDCGMCGKIKSVHEPYKIGQKLGMLTIREVHNAGNMNTEYYVCDCDCGTKGVVKKYTQMNYRDASLNCGCINIQKMKDLHDKTRKHGLSNTRIYEIYQGMMKRCYNPKTEMYYNYGGRGIYVCDEWKDQENYNGLKAFVKWSYENGYTDELSIDRKDNNGPYSPENCRWTTMTVQANNKRDSVYLTASGETYTLAQWEAASGTNQDTIRSRLNNGCSPEKCIYTPTPTNHNCINAIYFVDEYNNPISQFNIDSNTRGDNN